MDHLKYIFGDYATKERIIKTNGTWLHNFWDKCQDVTLTVRFSSYKYQCWSENEWDASLELVAEGDGTTLYTLTNDDIFEVQKDNLFKQMIEFVEQNLRGDAESLHLSEGREPCFCEGDDKK